jgi:arginine decarboxylase-like protein
MRFCCILRHAAKEKVRQKAIQSEKANDERLPQLSQMRFYVNQSIFSSIPAD